MQIPSASLPHSNNHSVPPTLTPGSTPVSGVEPGLDQTKMSVEAGPLLVERCKALLESGDVEAFNKLRPKGVLDLTGIDLRGKHLPGVDFDDVILSRANLERAYLANAKLRRVTADQACFDDATLDGAEFGGNGSFCHSTFNRAFIRKADLQFTNFTNSEFIDTQLQGSNISNGVFADTKCTRANFTGVIGVRAHFLGAALKQATFHKANLEAGYFVQSRGVDIDFSESNLCRSVFHCSIYQGEKLSFKGAYIKDWGISDFGFPLQKQPSPKPSQDGEQPRKALSAEERLKVLLKETKNAEPPANEFSKEIKKTDDQALVHGVPGSNIKLYQEALKELDALVGLKKVKDVLHELANFLMVNEWRREQGLKPLERNLHFVFTGNPGTGKTTIARIVAKIFAGVGYLPSDQLVETDRSGLVAGFVGQTEEKASKLIAGSMGRVLFIDEAYQLASAPGSNDYGDEAIAILLKQMEDNRGKFVVVVAGYPGPMQKFIESNPGLMSRFTEYIHFDDYEVGELTEIGKRMYSKFEYQHTPEFVAGMNAMYYMRKSLTGKDFGNGRDVRNIFEKSTAMQSTRLARENATSRQALTQMQIADLPTEQYLGLESNMIPWKDLRWKGKDGKDYDIHTFPLSSDYPELTEESKQELDNLIGAPAAELEQVFDELKKAAN